MVWWEAEGFWAGVAWAVDGQAGREFKSLQRITRVKNQIKKTPEMKYQVLHRTVAVLPLDKASVRSCRGRGNSCVLMMMGDRGGGKRAREEGEAARRGPGLGPPDFECQCSRSSAAAARGRESPAGGCESLALPRPSKSLHQGGEGRVGGHSARSQEPDSQTASRTARHLPTTPTVRDGKHPTFSRRQAGSQSLLAAPSCCC